MKNAIFKGLLTIGVLAAGLSSGSAQAGELLTNGGFETGDLTGWTRTSSGSRNNCTTDWRVLQSDTICNLPGTILNNPVEGNSAAFNSFDASNPINYTIEQDFTVGKGTVEKAELSWLQSYGWNFNFGRRATQERVFSLNIFDSSDNLIGNAFELTVGPNDGNTGFIDWENQTVDITNLLDGLGGETLTLVANVFIPEASTGPATFGLDKVSLDVETVPEPTSVLSFVLLGTLGIGIRGRKLPKSS